MDHTQGNPASVGTLDGAGNFDTAGKQVELPYPPSNLKRKGLSLFDQLVALAHRTALDLKYEHAYGPDCPPGKGWWSPAAEGLQHYVRARRRGRS